MTPPRGLDAASRQEADSLRRHLQRALADYCGDDMLDGRIVVVAALGFFGLVLQNSFRQAEYSLAQREEIMDWIVGRLDLLLKRED